MTSFPHPLLISVLITRVACQMPLVEQEPLTLPVHLSSPPVLSGVRVTRSLVSYVCFVDRCLSLCIFSFDHCVVCSSSIYRFLLPPLVSSNCSSYLHHFANKILRNNTSIIVPVVLVLFKHLQTVLVVVIIWFVRVPVSIIKQFTGSPLPMTFYNIVFSTYPPVLREKNDGYQNLLAF